MHNGVLAFIALSAGGASLLERSRSTTHHSNGCHSAPDDSTNSYEAAKEALHAIHKAGLLHGSVQASNVVRAPGGRACGSWTFRTAATCRRAVPTLLESRRLS